MEGVCANGQGRIDMAVRGGGQFFEVLAQPGCRIEAVFSYSVEQALNGCRRFPARSEPVKSQFFRLSRHFHNRRNWLFSWTELDAKHVGIVHSPIVTCRLHQIDPYDDLVDVLQRVGQHSTNPSTNSPRDGGSHCSQAIRCVRPCILARGRQERPVAAGYVAQIISWQPPRWRDRRIKSSHDRRMGRTLRSPAAEPEAYLSELFL